MVKDRGQEVPKKDDIRAPEDRASAEVMGRVAIIGGGIAGLTCALALRQQGVDVHI